MTGHVYTQEEFEFLDYHSDMPRKELTALFNARFGTSLTLDAIKGFCTRHWLSAGTDGRFQPGGTSWNAGMKGVSYPGSVPTQFKKGHRPQTWVPIGSERINADDYVDVKITDEGLPRRRWKGKHVLVWEEHNGPVPPGHCVILGDGNRRNFDADNLLLVSRGQLAIMNGMGLIQGSAELTRTGALIADVLHKVGERRR